MAVAPGAVTVCEEGRRRPGGSTGKESEGDGPSTCARQGWRAKKSNMRMREREYGFSGSLRCAPVAEVCPTKVGEGDEATRAQLRVAKVLRLGFGSTKP